MGLLNKSEKIFKVCSYLLVIVFALVTLYPIVYAFSVSISGKLAYESGLITLLPKDITLQAYEMVIERPANKSQVEISDLGERQKGSTKLSRCAFQN